LKINALAVPFQRRCVHRRSLSLRASVLTNKETVQK
jgi:hypothetical protein